MSKLYEAVTVDGVDIAHTFRGHNDTVEVYCYQAGNVTYSLYKKAEGAPWHCDWVTSYYEETIDLPANADDAQAMLTAFAAMLKQRGEA